MPQKNPIDSPHTTLYAFVDSAWNNHYLPLILILLGATFRTRAYLANRSLWYDEASLALDVLRNELFDLLGAGINAPEGFLILTKMATLVGGRHEMILRLAPFWAGLSSLPLIYILGKRLFDADSAKIALLLACVSGTLIYYSTEFKQYSIDVFVALLLYLFFWDTCRSDSRLSTSKCVGMALLGVLAIWISHPACFILAGIGTVLFANALYKNRWQTATLLSCVGATWLVSFGILYFFSLKHLGAQESLIEFWQKSYMPLPPFSLQDLAWFPRVFHKIFAYPTDMFPPIVGMAVFCAGVFAAAHHEKQSLAILLTPIGFTLLASGLHRYPFHGRLLLFLVPVLLLLIARGLTYLWKWQKTHHAAILLSAIIIVFPFFHTLKLLQNGPQREELRPVMRKVSRRTKPGDSIYVYYGARRAFAYYRPRCFSGEQSVTIGNSHRSKPEQYQAELDPLSSTGRVWILMSHVHGAEYRLFRRYINDRANILESVEAPGARAILCDFPTHK